MKNNILILILAAFAAVSCSLDYFPSDAMSSSQIKEDPESAVYATDGNYSMFKDNLDYNGTVMSGNSYMRHYFLMTELRGDNACLSGRTEDPLYQALCYNDDSNLYNLTYMWYIAYKIIYGANTMIESIPEGDPENDHLKGENYFLRALCHLDLCTMFAQPYALGRDNPGVVLRTSTDCSETERATVGAVYDQIVKDLEEAIRLMGNGTKRGNNGYASKEAAQGLLTRVYLHMGRDEDCINLVNEMLAGATPDSKLDPDYANLFANSLTSSEVLWCIGCIASDVTEQRSLLGSMYYSPDAPGSTGWGEIYWSQPIMDLFGRYPEDVRFSTMAVPYNQQNGYMIYWPVQSSGEDSNAATSAPEFICYSNNLDLSPTGSETEGWTATYTYEVPNPDDPENPTVVEEELPVYTETYKGSGAADPAGEYTRHYVMIDGEKTYATVSEKYGNRQTYPTMFMKKFSGNDATCPLLCSPIRIRWAEVILNRAEAYAHLNRDGEALNDVNVIRRRAQLPESAMFSESNMHGYTSVLDVVLDERRMELCFEGFRATDLFRNGKTMDRRFAGVQPWEEVAAGDSRFPFRIPFDEISVSGIPNN